MLVTCETENETKWEEHQFCISKISYLTAQNPYIWGINRHAVLMCCESKNWSKCSLPNMWSLGTNQPTAQKNDKYRITAQNIILKSRKKEQQIERGRRRRRWRGHWVDYVLVVLFFLLLLVRLANDRRFMLFL